MELLFLLIPLFAGSLVWLTNKKALIYGINTAGSILLLAASVLIAGGVAANGHISPSFMSNVFYIDSLSALILVVTCGIGFLVSLYSISYMDEEHKRGHISTKKLKAYFSLLNAFILTMLLTAAVQNMGLLWIAVEATTLSSAFLVGFYNDKKSIEAAWKYIIICSVGIAFALLGIILLYYSSVQSLGQSTEGINWQFLFQNAGKLQGSILKLSFIFVLVGFGTKVGLAPMHTWLPDAHSQAPSPISALLSGVLLNTAMYGIVRVMIIVNKNLGSSLFTGRLMIILGVVSVCTAAVFILVQQDFKRILAYSSIEHMGIIALGFGIMSPLSVFGALFHTVNHAFTKSMLFLASGGVFLKYETKKTSSVKGIMKVMPVTGTAFLLGIFAIAGMPPFSVFNSELNIIMAAFIENHYIASSLLLLSIVLVFAGFVTQMVKMFFGKPEAGAEEVKKGELDIISPLVLVIFLIVISVTGFYLPSSLKSLIDSAKSIIMGGV